MLVHKMENLFSKAPTIWPELLAKIIQIRNAHNYESEKKLAHEFAERYKREYPSLVSCLLEDLEALLSHLKLPVSAQEMLALNQFDREELCGGEREDKGDPGILEGNGVPEVSLLRFDRGFEQTEEEETHRRKGTQ